MREDPDMAAVTLALLLCASFLAVVMAMVYAHL